MPLMRKVGNPFALPESSLILIKSGSSSIIQGDTLTFYQEINTNTVLNIYAWPNGFRTEKKKNYHTTLWARIFKDTYRHKIYLENLTVSFIFILHFRYIFNDSRINSLFELNFIYSFYQNHLWCKLFSFKKVSMISPDSLYRPILNLSKTCNSKEQVFRSLLGTLTAALSCHQVVVFELHCKSL